VRRRGSDGRFACVLARGKRVFGYAETRGGDAGAGCTRKKLAPI
jgi:hypothetical protein